MALLGLMLVIQRSLSTACFLVARFLFSVVQRIYWELNGTGRRLRECTDPQYYERSAQVLDVLAAHRFCDLQQHSMNEFICVHNRFENPQFLVDNEHATLFDINEQNAVFVATKDKGVCCVFSLDIMPLSIAKTRSAHVQTSNSCVRVVWK